MSVSDAAKARAEAAFKRKEAQTREGAIAWAGYEAKSRAVAKERLRTLRLAKEAAATAQPQGKTVQNPVVNPRRGSHNQT